MSPAFGDGPAASSKELKPKDMLSLPPVNALLMQLDGSWVFLIGACVFGSLVGSFINVVVARLPAGMNIALPPSHCPACKTPIRPYHNVPIISWILLRARCFTCKTPISIRYPLVELLTALLFGACAMRYGATLAFAASTAFTGAMVAITFIDIDTWEIPDEIVLWGLPIVLILRPLAFSTPWWSGFLGAALGAGFLLAIRWVFFALRGVEAMGLGDVKLLAFIGGFLGPESLLTTITIGSLSGTIVGLILLSFDRFRPSDSNTDSDSSTPDQDPAEEPWELKPTRLRLGLVVRYWGQRITLGLPSDMRGRTHLRIGFLMGRRGPKGRSGIEVMSGLFQNVQGWGHFEGWVLGHPPRMWFGPVVGARLASVEAFGDDQDWVPPSNALPFGPFLALGALATMYFSPFFWRLAASLSL